MSNQIHLPFSFFQDIASLSIYADTKIGLDWMAGVTLEISNDLIQAIATDRYAIAHYAVKPAGMAVDSPYYLSISQATCKALQAVKVPKNGNPVCLVTYGDDVFSIEYQGITYKAEALPDLAKRTQRMLEFVEQPTEPLFAGFTLDPKHLVKLPKLSKDPWRFNRQGSDKTPPIVATCNDFTVIVQPLLERV